jgi:thiamine biosynthesis protein ThiS
MISLVLNGEPRTSSATTVSLLVQELDMAPATLLIEHNSTALLRSEWPETILREGDRLEFLRVAAGG